MEAYLEGTAGAFARSMGNAEKLQAFYENVATLPADGSSMFIRFVGAAQARNLKWWRGAWLQATSPIGDLTSTMKAGRKPTYAEALQLIPDPKTLAR